MKADEKAGCIKTKIKPPGGLVSFWVPRTIRAAKEAKGLLFQFRAFLDLRPFLGYIFIMVNMLWSKFQDILDCDKRNWKESAHRIQPVEFMLNAKL